MAEKPDKKALVLPASKALIKPNDRDQLLTKVESLKKKPPKAGTEYEFFDTINDFTELFSLLCWRYFGLTSAQQMKLSEKDLALMAKEVQAKAKTAVWKSWGWALPTIGLSLLFQASSARKYLATYKKLQNHYGENFFPYNAFLKFLKEDIKSNGAYSRDSEEDDSDLAEEEDLED